MGLVEGSGGDDLMMVTSSVLIDGAVGAVVDATIGLVGPCCIFWSLVLSSSSSTLIALVDITVVIEIGKNNKN